jgi:MazG family protein
MNHSANLEQLSQLLKTIAALRDPQTGCPWDLAQTHQSLLPYLFEESYEFQESVHALQEPHQKNIQELKNEMGDLLLQVLLHAQLASEQKWFQFSDVCEHLNKKMIERHPHVFGGVGKLSKDEVESQWKSIKAKNKTETSVTSKMPPKLLHRSALEAAHEIGKQSQSLGFDWQKVQEVMNKVEEELAELKEALKEKSSVAVEEEMGDFLFSAGQLARHLGLRAEATLSKANQKFLRRFWAMENICHARNLSWDNLNLDEKELLWKEVKSLEKTK